MGRHNKIGLSYYSVDTDRYQDIRIKKLIHNFSVSGMSVYDFVLNEIYRDKGYFLEWNEGTCFNIADVLKIKESLVSEVINYCCSVGLFNKAVLTNGNVLTSKSIQERYDKACVACKRKPIKIKKEFIAFTPEEISFIQEEMKVTHEESAQSKVKESKVKESKVKESKVKEVKPTELEFLEYAKENLKDRYHNLEFSIKAKFMQWDQNGWIDGNDKKINNWKTKLLNTIPFLKPNYDNAKKNIGDHPKAGGFGHL